MQRNTEHILISRLRSIQLALGMSERAFSQKLGWSPSFWNKVQAGESRIGPVTGGRMLEVYPELRPVLTAYLLEHSDDLYNQAVR